ncbi:hypothetical protein KY290_024491 [Solanum tuberosum]|uniref:Uncharacterized protein n=1 Tax=Solanum tuberosum TaxID=4113 RepID=A0ABQ7USW3_SOLTU|nr:hypothetical protein KY285_025392 [Solanum tuberosum]KAH0754221.1 hypothetical protein KY290_024491 [Solanum tuberosum]
MMMSPTPSVNKAYSMLIDQESQRALVNFTRGMHIGDTHDGTALLSHTRPSHNDVTALFGYNRVTNHMSGSGGSHHGASSSSNYRGKKTQVLCEVCGFKGHTKDTCYRIVGYPADLKGRKKGVPAHYQSSHAGNIPFANHTSVLTAGTGTSSQHRYWPQQIGHQLPLQQFPTEVLLTKSPNAVSQLQSSSSDAAV